MPSLPYNEPDITTLLSQSSFLLLLNLVDFLLNYALYCGLLGQVLLGIAFGKPGGNFLNESTQQAIVQLGYIGLILLIYEGGLSVCMRSVWANLGLSTGVALTGIAAPIALSFVLQPLLNATPLQAFAAGASLCSTSLGTTFAVLNATGLAKTRLASVLSTAAMMDDVVGLVMVQIISNLGSSSGPLDPAVVVRPIAVSVGFVILVPLVCHYAIRPIRRSVGDKSLVDKIRKLFATSRARFVLHSVFLFGMTAAAGHSGTSVLFTAYLSGAVINWWDTESTPRPSSSIVSPEAIDNTDMVAKVDQTAQMQEDQIIRDASKPEDTKEESPHRHKAAVSAIAPKKEVPIYCDELSGQKIYAVYFYAPVERIFKPFFFASIGFSIPISSLFEGSLIWRGIVYTVLMVLAKLLCGVWLLRYSFLSRLGSRIVFGFARIRKTLTGYHLWWKPSQTKEVHNPTEHTCSKADTAGSNPMPSSQSPPKPANFKVEAPVSLYPGAMLGFAMVARGEIGFLISSIAESKGVWKTAGSQNGQQNSDIFITVTWAIFLCTFIGPVAVGLIVRRVRRLERTATSGGRAALGSWGLQ
ncbi:hypothetical protein BT63DRAFT_236793 [Microthyrium microscopicum]|uniref:Cation/H+ exchanger transmembrane domain-containing protein n=1 Tax=Microthyrium microscopicum TaxID=703497 RepID=A0A6A6UFP7_9PEZI|nr:hypothetical protein BT63DRAFT_236793 [Microthyrium microscopicum]